MAQQKLCMAYGAAGRAQAEKWCREGRGSQRTAYWRASKNHICRFERLGGHLGWYGWPGDDQGRQWWSATLTVTQAFERRLRHCERRV